MVPIGDAVDRMTSGELIPTMNVTHHWLDWRLVLSTAPAQKPCGPDWLATGTQLRMIL